MFRRAGSVVVAVGLLITFFLCVPSFGQDVSSLFAEAKEKVLVKDFEGALSVYDEILDRYPDDMDALNGKGRVLAWMGRYDEARKTFREALRVDPENLDARLGIADTYAWQWDYERALSIVRNLEKRYPGEKEVLIRLSRYSLWAGERDEAVYYARKVKRDFPGDEEADELLRKASSVYGFEASIGYEFLNITDDEDGHTVWGSISHRPNPDRRYFGTVEMIDRFGENEVRLAGGLAMRVSDTLQISIEGGVAPGADFFPRYSGWVELASPAVPAWVMYGSFSVQSFSDADVYSFSVAAEYYPYGYLSIYGRGTLSKSEFDRGGSSTDGSVLLKTTWFFTGSNEVHAYVGYGNEAYRAETLDLVGDIEAKIAGAGGTYFIDPSLGVSPGFEFQERGGGTRYYSFSLELKYRW